MLRFKVYCVDSHILRAWLTVNFILHLFPQVSLVITTVRHLLYSFLPIYFKGSLFSVFLLTQWSVMFDGS